MLLYSDAYGHYGKFDILGLGPIELDGFGRSAVLKKHSEAQARPPRAHELTSN